MPADEDYGRRQIPHQQQQQQQQPSTNQQQNQQQQQQQQSQQQQNASPVPVQCSAGCIPSPADHRRLAAERYDDRFASERFGSERSSSERLPSGERYQYNERISCPRYPERCTPVQNVGSLDRYHHGGGTLDRYSRTSTPTDRYHTLTAEKDRYNEDRYTPTERRSNPKIRPKQQQQQQYQYDRFPPIPCPERFATQPERIQYAQQVQYLEPPSPAPASDRFIPPPPLSPENTPSPDCYVNNAFPSPTTALPERFIPPPPLSPSPTEKLPQQRYHIDRKYYNPYSAGERYIPPNAHTPVERYVPQPQEYYQQYQHDRYKYNPSSSDPYMRRDLAFHYRLPLPYNPTQYQRLRYVGTPNRQVKCCGYQEGYQLSKSSPGSSSSSSVTSQKESQCQIATHQEEKSTQCVIVSPSMRKTCRHGVCSSPSVEYVGGAGGRHVCATPPPVGAQCDQQCCQQAARRPQATLQLWRASPQPTQQPQQIIEQRQTPTPQPQLNRSSTPVSYEPQEQQVPQRAEMPENKPSTPPAAKQPIQTQTTPPQGRPQQSHQRAVSMPDAPTPERTRPQQRIQYSQSERAPNRQRPPLNRSMSKKEIIKNYIRKETANFFGVDEEHEEEQQSRWLDRRKRMACRTLGPLKDEFRNNMNDRTHRRTISDRVTSERISGQLVAERPDVLPGPSDATDGFDRHATGLRRKDSVARMTLDGLSYVVTTLTRNRPRPRSQQQQWSRSFPPDSPPVSPPSSPEEQSFFDNNSIPMAPRSPELEDAVDRGRGEAGPMQPYRSPSESRFSRPTSGGWRRDTNQEVVLRHGDNRTSVGGTRIYSSMLDHVLDNSDRRQYGMGWVGRMFGRSMRRSVAADRKIQEQLDDLEDHRPMFTYWVTTVQVLVLLISIICYGIGPFGVNLQSRSGQILVTSLSLQQVDFMEPANFWVGPRAADLIHLGAKFAPCMRVDDKVSQQIDKIRAKERETACCIRNDDSGCVQSTQSDCSKTISTFKKWTAGEAGPGGRISGSVCGLDPKFCDAPASVHPYEWPDDITKWPICRKTNTQFSTQKKAPRDKLAEHMVCEIIGHPCCIGIHGQCKITTKEYCDFVMGTFHEEASLCSQVSCLNDVCGMLPFYFPDVPDQFYRLWTSLFLHAGILQLVITVLLQVFLMRDLEKLTGSLRIGIVYIGSGVAGNLASAIFVPYRADVGPAGSQFGLLACLIVEVLNAWPMLKKPRQALMKLLSLTAFLFLLGLLPWVDNYAHLFGFIFGFLLSYALLPFISFGRYDRQKKVFLIWVCLLSAGILFITLVLLFYIIPVYDCKVCSYFNCIPFTRDFCASQNINFKREEPVV
ncbi:unnamed protein product [Brassicogethes aeneus]|uniref:Peptidase S54 rhomboid domain-containing protein n=1 Tax=Brassicogethes aeneus TaxID=1431903 RepID=A0A9P0BKL8_BRAAE|nr:unnamed protein product [Brassicogethes aeneus]